MVVTVKRTPNRRVVLGDTLRKRNARLKQEQPLCVMCLAEGYVKAGEQIDHIVPLFKGGEDVESNLQNLCIDCHKKKSAAERSSKPEIGLDGWPVQPASTTK